MFKANDLVLIRYAGGKRLAVLVSVDPTFVRIWRPDLNRFERNAIRVRPDTVLRLAPEDEQTAAARRTL